MQIGDVNIVKNVTNIDNVGNINTNIGVIYGDISDIIAICILLYSIAKSVSPMSA